MLTFIAAVCLAALVFAWSELALAFLSYRRATAAVRTRKGLGL